MNKNLKYKSNDKIKLSKIEIRYEDALKFLEIRKNKNRKIKYEINKIL